MIGAGKKRLSDNRKSIRYAIIIFVLWVVPPFALAFLVYLVNSSLLKPAFLTNLLVPAIILAVISYALSRVRNPLVSKGTFFALIGALIWASPAIYFLPASNLYQALTPLSKLIVILAPAAVLSALFFFIAKAQLEKSENLSDFYVKKALYSR